ncbi:hypothetical protein, partial [Teichococcus cervicalis]|uniref:hypothetical protein n=1 Tax=Teichococcus cervicalis TaxID=204525 RepID=UPI00059057AD
MTDRSALPRRLLPLLALGLAGAARPAHAQAWPGELQRRREEERRQAGERARQQAERRQREE